MGADGGTIPKRCELVKNKKKKEKVDKNVKNASRWRICRLSQDLLKRPIVACRLGGLYNKEAVINAILTKTIGESDVAKHIRGLKDIRELKLTDNKEYKESVADKGDTYKDHNVAPFCCPITGIAMNGNYPFAVNWKCGCVISERAIREVRSDVCHGCGGPFVSEDLVILNPSEELLQQYEQKLANERSKKAMKKKNGEKAVTNECDSKAVNKSITEQKQKTINETTAPRKAEKRKAENINNNSSIQDDASKSSAYKSLFTTCEEAKRKPQQHWVTHNPLFY